MQYMTLPRIDQETLLRTLQTMPDELERAFGDLTAASAARPGSAGGFAPVEHCWHLADLEREGFGRRLERLRRETEPHLPDFDGGRIAVERRYRARSLADGIAAFRAARNTNLEVLRGLTAEDWTRSGTQEGVGRVSLCDLPAMMAAHDAEHRAEIEQWKAAR